ncbi:calcium-activated chloride channel-domain-containing protein [Vararia minispora EC-137]|uniref:Calcium-activated chloride channel-domain-containing protein n=1 Tax=Vararia minispora EC-137 TaxID=1314806 RepID=A0ACB8QAX3_9AGAM|nr:calcium-activated chloride channel-domain-containing protein [Vararia minispora EC-137]
MQDPSVDLVLLFRAPGRLLNKQHARDEAAQAEQQYTRLLSVFASAGLRAVGRPGDQDDQLLVFLSCSDTLLSRLVQRERHSDFVYGVSTATLPSAVRALDTPSLSPSERLRLVYTYVTAVPADGGLGISPDAPEWSRVHSIMALHDAKFNEVWLRSLANRQIRTQHLDDIRSQFGEDIAFYFAFLVSYTRFLLPIALLGVLCFQLGRAYSATYSGLLCLWCISFVEYWRIRERIFSVCWGTQGIFRVEKRRLSYIEGTKWWQREFRTLASVPIILLFATVLFGLLTAIFVFEAFVTTLYTGPGHEYIGFAPTILLVVLVPRFLAAYQSRAARLTQWENHRHQSSHDASLTIKTFALAAVVAYLGLALSAFVYVPFGADLMALVQHALDGQFAAADKKTQLFDTVVPASAKLNTRRLQNQMFAYTVTNQIVSFGTETVLPFVQRFVSGTTRKGVHIGHKRGESKKRVGFEDQAPRVRAERAFIERVRREAALPEYETFADYSEMVTQFGYVALWSTIWPLAAVCAWLNNVIELRSDALKIVAHCRRPLPRRTDTIGPWLACLTFLAWLAALSNAALVYLFRPARAGTATALERAPRDQVLAAALVALSASHAFFAVRAAVRHVLVRVLWKGSKEEEMVERAGREVKEAYLKGIAGPSTTPVVDGVTGGESGADAEFWSVDEGLDEIRRTVKDL